LRFQKITISQLEYFIQSGEYLQFGPIPITPIRAISQSKNPKAHPDDVVLTLAISDDEELIGYIGALPDQIGNIRCAWNSGWWVKDGSPAEVSLKLFFSFLSDWDKKVLFSEMTPHTSLLIEKLKFCTHRPVIGLRGYSRFCLAEILPQKKPLLKNLRIIFRLIDFIGNLIIGLFNFLFPVKKFISEKITINELKTLTGELDEFISKHNQKQPTARYSEDFNWIVENQWVVQKQFDQAENDGQYFFSWYVSRFEMHWVKFLNDIEMVALVCYSIRDNKLKIQYVFAEENCIPEIGNYFYSLLRANKRLCSITTFHSGLANYLSNNKKFLYKTYLQKLSAMSNVLMQETSITEFETQMGDGDCIFT
jgi:hypothetical protein